MRAKQDRFVVCLAALACASGLAFPVCAHASGAFLVSGTLVVAGGGGAPTPLAPAGPPQMASGVVLITGTPIMAASSSSNATSNSDPRGPDEKWGDPLSTKLLNTDSVQAGFNYYAGSGWNGSQGGISFSLKFKN